MIYLDHNATTPLDPRVKEAMRPSLEENFGNPASGQHSWGWTAEAAVKKARGQVAALIGADPGEIYFTSGATEANNWALWGLVRQWKKENPGQKIHVLVSAVEHRSVLNAAEALRDEGVLVDVLPVDREGFLQPETLRRALRPETKFLSAIWVQNEIGTINPVAELARICREHQILFHSDATQAVGKIPVNLASTDSPDLISFSGHKISGPKGVGALFIRGKNPKVQIQPLMYGGGHEKGLRSGTLNVPGIVGLGAACELASAEMAQESLRLQALRDRLWSGLQKQVPGVRLNGATGANRSPINLSLTFPGRPVDLRMARLSRLGFSTGSACSAGRTAISHVLAAIGLGEAEATCTIRVSVGHPNTEAEVDQAVAVLAAAFCEKTNEVLNT